MRILGHVILGFLLTIFVFIGVSFYLFFFYKNPPVEYYNNPITVDKKVYSPGDHVWMELDRCKYVDVPIKIYVTWVCNDLIYSQPIYEVGGSDEQCGIIKVPNEVPILNQGQCYIRQRNVYEVLPFIERDVDFKTEKFLIEHN